MNQKPLVVHEKYEINQYRIGFGDSRNPTQAT